MNWFRENRFLGTFLIVLGLALVGSLLFLWSARAGWDEASARFSQTAADLNGLEQRTPYPSQENLRKMKAHAEDYANAFAKLKDELKLRVPAAMPLAPNELQSRLRMAMTAVAEKARANKVKLPEKFYLGFDEFAAALPANEAAPLLGQELAQVEWLVNTLIDARVEALTAFRRIPPAESAAAPGPTPSATAKSGTSVPNAPGQVERSIVEATFLSTPAAARRALNQIAGANQQFFIIRLLHVRNEKDKGPTRESGPEGTSTAAATPAAVPAGSPGAKLPGGTALNFIVGNERIETSARIEIVRFTF